MNRMLKSTLVVVPALIFIGGVTLSIHGRQADRDEKAENAKKSEKNDSGRRSERVKLDAATQKRIGIEPQALELTTASPEVTVYGRLEEDPSEQFVLRSPITGTVVSDGNWPQLGAHVTTGAKVGTVRARLTAMDQLTLNQRFASIHSDIDAAQSAVTTAREETNRLTQLNADNKNASDKALQEAQSRLATEEARLKAARASEHVIGSFLQAGSDAGSVPLGIRKDGQVVELSAQPGESVENGQVLIRVANFNRLLARLYVPLGQVVDTSVTRAMIAPAGHEEVSIPAQRVALTASVDPRYQGQILLFRLSASRQALRPGQAVSARIAVPGPKERGVVIPSGAILRFQGQTWVYVQAEPGEFVRHAVTLKHPAQNGWLITSDLQPGQLVVLSGTQVLLSEEMKSQLESDEE